MSWVKHVTSLLIIVSMLAGVVSAEKSDTIFEDHGIAASSELGVRFVPTGEYYVISKTGNESLYDVEFTHINVTVDENITQVHTQICAVADFEEYNYTVTTDKTGAVAFILRLFNVNTNVTENITYKVPTHLPIQVDGASKTELTKVLEKESKNSLSSTFEKGDTQRFCYTANPATDFFVKMGENSITIGQVAALATDLFLQNATDEPVFTHLNVLNKNMTLLMNFDKTNGTTKAYDLTKYGHDGDFVGDAFINPSGFAGGSLQLDGSGDYVNLGDNLDNVGVNFTMAAWIKTSGGSTEDMIIAKKDDTSTGYYMFIAMAGEANARFDDSILAIDATSTTFINDDLWHHVVAVRGGEELRLYVDGSEEDSQSGMGLGSIENSQDLLIGKSSHSFDYSFTGQIDNAFIWNRSLSAIEVEKLYNSTLPLFSERGQQTYKSFNVTTTNENRVNITTTDYNRINGTEIKVSVGEWDVSDGYDESNVDLIASWHLDNESSLGEHNTKIVDSSGNGNNGTVVGAVVNIQGKYDGAFDFDGTNDYINSNKLPGLDLNESSFSIWLKWTHSDAWEAVLSSVDVSDTSIGLQINRRGDSLANSAGDLVLLLQDEDDNKWLGGTVGESFNDGEWHQIVWNVVSGTANDIDLYVDGVSVGTSTQEASNPDNFVPLLENVLLGARNLDGSVSRYFNGTIDEVKVYNRSLTADEIKEDYIKGKLNYTFGGDQSLNNVDANDNLSVNKFRISNASSQFVARYTMTSNIDNSYTPWIADKSINYTFHFVSDDFPPRIAFQDPTPVDGATIAINYTIINISIEEANLAEVIYDWNGTNFTFYNDSLLLLMNFDNRSEIGDSNTNVADLSKYGHDGTHTANSVINLTNGKYDGALDLDGTGDFVNVGSAIDAHFGNTITFGAWINPRELGVDAIIDQTSSELSGLGIHLRILDSGGKIRCYTGDTGDNFLDSVATVSINTWTHVMCKNDGAGLTIYLNGIQNSVGIGASAVTKNGNNLYIGASQNFASLEFNGYIDDALIVNRSLSALEINQLYMSSLTKFNTSHWELSVNQSNSSNTGLVDGTYTYQAHVVDSFNLRNDTEIRTLIVNTSAPETGDSFGCTYSTGNWIINATCQTTANVNVCPNNINITTNGYLNITNNAIVEASKVTWEPKGSLSHRVRWFNGGKLQWGAC